MTKIPSRTLQLIKKKTKIFKETVFLDQHAYKEIKHRALSVNSVKKIVQEAIALCNKQKKKLKSAN